MRKGKAIGNTGNIVLLIIASLFIVLLFTSSGLTAKKKLRLWVQGLYTWQQISTKYEKENPGVDIEIVSGTIDKFYTLVSAGLMPDVWGPWDTPGITADVNRNWATDLTPFIARDGKSMKINDFFPGLMRQFKVKGKQYSLPIFYYVDWYFYDTKKYAEAGLAPPPVDPKDRSWTWDLMVSNAMKTTKYNSRGVIQQGGMDFSRGFDNCNWTKLWGAHLYDAEGIKSSIPQNIYLKSPEMVTALTKAWELIYRYKVTSPVQSWFYDKKIAASIECGYQIKNVMPVKSLKWALAPLPYGKTNSGTTYPDGWRISRICRDKELAWDFIKFLCKPDSMKVIVLDAKSNYRGSGVARKSVFYETMAEDISNVTGMKPSDVLSIYEGADDVGEVQDREVICLHTDINRTYLEPILLDLWNNKMSPVDAATRLQNQANKALPELFQRWIRNVKFSSAGK